MKNTAKFVVQSIDSYSDFTDFTASTYSINALATGTEDIVSENGVTIGSATVLAFISGTYTYQTVSYYFKKIMLKYLHKFIV